MNELMTFIENTNQMPAEQMVNMQDQQMNNVVVDTTTLNPNAPPAGYKIEVEGYGTVAETKDKGKKIYDLNVDFISNLGNERTSLDLKYSGTVFQQLNRLPVIDGKQYSLSQIEAIYNDPEQSDLQKRITAQARKLSTNPELSPTVQWELIMNDLNGVMIEGQIQSAKLKFDNSLFETARVLEANRKAKSKDKPEGTQNQTSDVNVPFTFLFKKDGSFKSFDEFAIDYINQQLPQYNKTAQTLANNISLSNAPVRVNDEGKIVANNMYRMKEQQEAGYWDRMNKINSLPEWQAKEVTNLLSQGKEREADAKLQSYLNVGSIATNLRRTQQGIPGLSSQQPTSPSRQSTFKILPQANDKNWKTVLTDMGRAYAGLDERNKVKLLNYDNLLKNYEKYKEALVEEYNNEKNPTSFKLGAVIQSDFQNKFGEENKGGEIKGTKQSYLLDLSNPIIDQQVEEVRDEITGEVKQVRKNIFSPAANQFVELYQLVKNDDGQLRYGMGEISNVPSNNKNRDAVLQLFQSVLSSAAQRTDKGKIKGVAPTGKITYQGVVGGQTEYHAFNVYLDDAYINRPKFRGTETNKGLIQLFPEVLTGGVTIYVPANISEQKTTLGRQNYNSRTVSAIEGLVNLNGKIDIPVSNAGGITIAKDDKNGAWDISGYNVVLNPSTMKMDTTKFESYKVPYSATFDIDKNVTEVIGQQFFNNFMFNAQMYKQMLIQKGEKDPNKLLFPIPYKNNQ